MNVSRTTSCMMFSMLDEREPYAARMAHSATEAQTKPREWHSPAPAVTRAAALLGLLVEPDARPLGLSDFARRLGLPKSSVANLCAALEQADMLRRVNGGYMLGPRLLELGSAYLRTVDALQDFRETCRTLPVASQETLLLATLDDLDVLYLARHDGTQPIRLGSDIGRRLPAACTALGKAMLAQIDPRDVADQHRRLPEFPILTPKSLRNLDELLAELERTRERGYAIDDEENTPGVTCYAVAIPGSPSAQQRRGVSVTLLKARETPQLRDDLVADLRQLAAHLSMRSAVGLGQPS
jgi:DNA-binding IclR family transcriptional regulator